MKRRYQDPYIVVTGDFNQWKIEEALGDFRDISVFVVGNTRNGRALDRIFLNQPTFLPYLVFHCTALLAVSYVNNCLVMCFA